MAKKLNRSRSYFDQIGEKPHNRYKAKARLAAHSKNILLQKHGPEKLKEFEYEIKNRMDAYTGDPANKFDGSLKQRQALLENIAGDLSKENPNFMIPSKDIGNYFDEKGVKNIEEDWNTLNDGFEGDNVQGRSTDPNAIGFRNYVSDWYTSINSSDPYVGDIESSDHHTRRKYNQHGINYDLNTGDYNYNLKDHYVGANPEKYKAGSENSMRTTGPTNQELKNNSYSLPSNTANPNVGGQNGVPNFDYSLPSNEKVNTPKLNQSSLPQHGFGDWLGRNAGTIGSVAGGALGGVVGSVIPGAGTMAGAALGASLGGKVGGSIQENHINDENAEIVADENSYAHKLGLSQNQLKESQSQDLVGTQGFKKNGGPLKEKSIMETPDLVNMNYSSNANSQNYSMPRSKNMPNAKKMEEGGALTPYSGQTHSGPNQGIPVDKMGNPTVISEGNPVGLVEGGESTWINPKDPNKTPYVLNNNDQLKFEFHA